MRRVAGHLFTVLSTALRTLAVRCFRRALLRDFRGVRRPCVVPGPSCAQVCYGDCLPDSAPVLPRLA
jgi:hypothetical protein